MQRTRRVRRWPQPVAVGLGRTGASVTELQCIDAEVSPGAGGSAERDRGDRGLADPKCGWEAGAIPIGTALAP